MSDLITIKLDETRRIAANIAKLPEAVFNKDRGVDTAGSEAADSTD
jgi:hypothetical protein